MTMPTAKDYAINFRLDLKNNLSQGFMAAKGQARAFMTDMNRLSESYNKMAVGAGAAGLALAAPAVVAGNEAMKLERSVANAAILSGKHGKAFRQELNLMSKSARKLGADLGFMPVEVADAMRILIQTGVNPADAGFEKMLTTSLKFSKIGMMGPAQSIETLAKTINAFKLQSGDYSKVMNILFKAGNISMAAVEGLSESFKRAAPVASSFNVGIEDTVSLLMGLAQGGLTGSSAGNIFGQLVNNIYSSIAMKKPTGMWKTLGIDLWDKKGGARNVLDIMSDLEIKTSKMTAKQKAFVMTSLFNRRGYFSAVAELNSGMKAIFEFRKRITGASDAEASFNDIMTTSDEKLKQFKAQLSGVLAVAGTPLLSKFNDLIASGRGFLDVLEGMELKSGTLSKALSGGLNIGATLLVFSGIAKGIGLVTKSLSGLAGIAPEILILKNLMGGAGISGLLVGGASFALVTGGIIGMALVLGSLTKELGSFIKQMQEGGRILGSNPFYEGLARFGESLGNWNLARTSRKTIRDLTRKKNKYGYLTPEEQAQMDSAEAVFAAATEGWGGDNGKNKAFAPPVGARGPVRTKPWRLSSTTPNQWPSLNTSAPSMQKTLNSNARVYVDVKPSPLLDATVRRANRGGAAGVIQGARTGGFDLGGLGTPSTGSNDIGPFPVGK